jgi:hypothetical protein
MTREDIIYMARRAGYSDSMADLHAPALERFYSLVIAHEREACAKLCESMITEKDIYPGNFVIRVCAKSIRARGDT